jgi:hypothetical protein
MAEVRQDRGGILPGSASGGRSVAVLVMALVAVLAAIALIFNASRRSAHQPPAAVENVEPPAPPPPAAQPEPSPAAGAAPVGDEGDGAATARRQAAIARAIDDGRPGLAACYQRALVRDDSLVHGKVTVRASIAPSGRVDSVNVAGPAAFRAMQPCLHRAIARWDFPAAPDPYTAEIPLVLQGNQ